MHVGSFLHSNCIEFNGSTRAPRGFCVRMPVYVCLMRMKNSGEGWGTKEVHSSVAPSANHVGSSFLPGDEQVWSMCTWALGPTQQL